jgi:hypothetical protein
MLISIRVRFAVWSALAQAAREAASAQPERLATAWALRMPRFHVPF